MTVSEKYRRQLEGTNALLHFGDRQRCLWEFYSDVDWFASPDMSVDHERGQTITAHSPEGDLSSAIATCVVDFTKGCNRAMRRYYWR